MARDPHPTHPQYWIHKRLEAIENAVEALLVTDLEDRAIPDEGPLAHLLSTLEQMREARDKYRP